VNLGHDFGQFHSMHYGRMKHDYLANESDEIEKMHGYGEDVMYCRVYTDPEDDRVNLGDAQDLYHPVHFYTITHGIFYHYM
jgi:hypothetical protein